MSHYKKYFCIESTKSFDIIHFDMVGWLVYGGFQPYYLIENDHLGYWSPEKDFRRRLTFWQRVRKLSSESRQKDAEELRFCFVLFCFYLIYLAIVHAINNNKIYPDKYTLIEVAKSSIKQKTKKKLFRVRQPSWCNDSTLVLKSFLGDSSCTNTWNMIMASQPQCLVKFCDQGRKFCNEWRNNIDRCIDLMEFCNCRKIPPRPSMLGGCLLLTISFTECPAQKCQRHCNRVLSKYSRREFLFYLKNRAGIFFFCLFVNFMIINVNILVLPKCCAIYYYFE